MHAVLVPGVDFAWTQAWTTRLDFPCVLPHTIVANFSHVLTEQSCLFARVCMALCLLGKQLCGCGSIVLYAVHNSPQQSKDPWSVFIRCLS